jgi:uncharacterized protein (TIGR02996 family)
VQSAPRDTGLLLIYSDWLEERGDIRAEFLRTRVVLGKLSPNEAQFQVLWSQLRRLRSGIDPAWLAVLDGTPLFAPLEAAIARKNREDGFDASHAWCHQLTVNLAADSLDVEYEGEYELWLEDRTTVTILQDLLRLLASAEVAPSLRSFTYRTEAVLAANGTYDYNIDPLLEGVQPFPNLVRLSLDQGAGEHGYKILTSPLSGDDWHEAGVLARMLDKAPRLEALVTPVCPNESFFQGRPHPLQFLDVDAGFGRADLIRHLTGCSRFPDLRRLVFTDFRQYYLDDWRERTTQFEDYVLFFRSPVASRLQSICLREVNLTPDQIRRLLDVRSEGVEITRSQESGPR